MSVQSQYYIESLWYWDEAPRDDYWGWGAQLTPETVDDVTCPTPGVPNEGPSGNRPSPD